MATPLIKTSTLSNSLASTALLAAANAALGCGVAMLVADKIGSRGRRTVAWASMAVAVAALVPAVVDLVTEQINGPYTRRGARDRLRSIREGSGFADEAEMA